ncbi:MAG: energy transducer TonB [Shimia sp.]|uniref:energy transducer TonB n=1 Tax=Shimia sp. TaxID=1954381 RepID=UPI00405806E6
MHIGQYISGAAHVGLIGWVLFGGVFRSDAPQVEVSEVAIISAEDFAALSQPNDAPDLSTDVSALTSPTETTEAPDVPVPQDEAVQQPAPDETAAAEPDVTPEVPDPQPPAPQDVTEEAPVLPTPEVDTAVVIPNTPVRPEPRPTTRVAPEPVPQPKPDTTIADDLQEATKPDEAGQAQEEVKEETAPEAASSEIVTEPTEEEVASAAPTTSVRPRVRPSQPTPTPAAEPKPEGTDAAVAAALAEAGASEPTPSTNSAPSGPPLTGGEKDALVVAVQQCWVVDVGSRAADVTVVVGLSLDRGGKVAGDIRLVDASGGDDAAVRTAFQSARRAVLRCQKSGFDLPQEKYDHWKEVEITFNPEKMRSK